MEAYGMNDWLMTPEEVAGFLRVTVGTLAVWRCTKCYDLKPIKVGKRLVRYRYSVVLAFLEEWMPTQPA